MEFFNSRKSKKVLALGGLAFSSIVVAAPHAHEAYDAVSHEAPWVVGSLVASEAAWNIGAATMLVSTGARLGNPLKIRSEFKGAKNALAAASNTNLFKTGMAMNVIGEAGTASTLVGVSMAKLPVEVWPLTMGTAVGLLLPSAIAWKGIYNVHKDSMKHSLSGATEQISETDYEV